MIGNYYQYNRISRVMNNLKIFSDDKGQVERFEYILVKGSVKCLYNPFIPTNTDYIPPDKYWILNKY